jgi:uncharacterized protein (TIGR02646 family)
MRPINRGDIPVDVTTKKPKVFAEYKQARSDLISRIGEYCSYCEMHLDTNLAIEHVQPKKHHHDLEMQWDNFLLACTNCNSYKGSNNLNLDEYVWPDRDNTYWLVAYHEGGIVEPNPELELAEQEKVWRTIALVGLDKIPTNDPAASDRRWNNRREAWEIATESLTDLMSSDTDEMKRQIIRTAQAKGYWSIWMTVFSKDTDPARRIDMLRRFLDKYPGTSSECFDENLKPVQRREMMAT